MVKNPPAMQETQVQSLGREDPLEKESATHSSILAWRIPWTEEPAGLLMGSQRVRHDWSTNWLSFTSCLGSECQVIYVPSRLCLLSIVPSMNVPCCHACTRHLVTPNLCESQHSNESIFVVFLPLFLKDLLCSIVLSHLCRGHGNPLQYSCLEHPHEQSLAATVHGVTESDTTEWLNIAEHINGLNLDQEFGGMLPKKMGLPVDW